MTGLAVYVHIPFCTVKCGYCDFNAYAGLDALKPAYGEALLREVDAWAPTLAGRTITSIAFGGGTPSEVPPAQIAAVVEALAARASLVPDAEVSLEVNPGTSSLDALRRLRAAGVNRLSIGAQSFNPTELRFLDRIHSPEATATCARLARRAGFDSLNLDLIYGLPGQGEADWERSLACALALAPDHLSAYSLSVEEGTALAARVARGRVAAPDPDAAVAMYDRARLLLTAAGFEHYEISNWARPRHRSRHNLVYWTDGEYLGLGAGAHGYLQGRRYENVAQPRKYIAALVTPAVDAALPATVASVVEPSPRIAMFDWLETRLRLVAGFDPVEFAARFGCSLTAVAGPPLAACAAAGLVDVGTNLVRLTPAGYMLHSEVCVRVLAHLPKVMESIPLPFVRPTDAQPLPAVSGNAPATALE
ncbi:MAG: radical SAM family heme chaperone HemW [Dehalococcoidia bacterium]|nr:radical SAM family heme chaperone HemW [Dehalococcoidia bacterium]